MGVFSTQFVSLNSNLVQKYCKKNTINLKTLIFVNY
jgi:hypothetical protein